MKLPSMTAGQSVARSTTLYPCRSRQKGEPTRVIPNLVVWGEDHQPRAEALAAVVGETAIALGDLVDTDSTDATLTLWAHGDQLEFAGYTEVQIADRIAAYKKGGGKKTTTVELVTCDAQHAQNDNYNAFALRVKNVLKTGHGVDLTVKALPVSAFGAGSESILWANAGNRQFLYGTARNHTGLQNKINTPVTTGEQAGKNLLEIGQELAKANDGNYTVSYGKLENLRHYLVKVG